MTDTCQTPGCGHERDEHWTLNVGDHMDTRCCYPGCSCTAFLPPRPVPEEAGLTSDAQARRDLWREAAEKGIEQGVDWPRIVLTLFDDIDRLTATVPAPHAEAEAAWRNWSDIEADGYDGNERRAFIAGYLRGRGDHG